MSWTNAVKFSIAFCNKLFVFVYYSFDMWLSRILRQLTGAAEDEFNDRCSPTDRLTLLTVPAWWSVLHRGGQQPVGQSSKWQDTLSANSESSTSSASPYCLWTRELHLDPILSRERCVSTLFWDRAKSWHLKPSRYSRMDPSYIMIRCFQLKHKEC